VAQQPQGARLLIRAERTRRMTEDYGSLWACMEQQPLAGVQYLAVPRQGSRRATAMYLLFTGSTGPPGVQQTYG